jgi:glycosyltransferase involved in cell wall biosynthesis
MRVLLVHRNFPGQFRHLAPALRDAGHEVAVLTWKENPNPQPFPHAKYAHEAGPTRELGATYVEAARTGAAAARTASAIRAKQGYVPDVVFGVINWGETLFLREVWPEARHLGYAEFLYATRGLDTGFDPEFSRGDLASRVRIIARKAHLLQGALDADALVAPTEWQAASFPPEIRRKMSVVHDGVDTDRLTPDPSASYQVPGGPFLRAGDEVITFVNRNLEPYRGFHTFMRALPSVLAARPGAQVVLVGGETGGYGPRPGGDRTWKEVMMAELGDRLDLSRLHFVGRVPYADLLSILRVGRVHAYLSYPFVLSWSMLEAMSLGAYVVGSATPPVEEVIEDGRTGRLVDFFDVAGWADALIAALSDPERQAPIRAAARRHVVESYDLRRVCLPRLIRFVETGHG